MTIARRVEGRLRNCWKKSWHFQNVVCLFWAFNITGDMTHLWRFFDNFSYIWKEGWRLNVSNKIKTTFKLSCYCHDSWDTLYIELIKPKPCIILYAIFCLTWIHVFVYIFITVLHLKKLAKNFHIINSTFEQNDM